MNSRRKENAMNENRELRAHTLSDLLVADEQAEATKGGTTSAPYKGSTSDIYFMQDYTNAR